MFNIKGVTRAIIMAVTSVFVFGAAGGAIAATKWQQSHPRRAEVNHRLGNQDKRINQERREGELSKAQAQTLHRDDRGIRSEERTMASLDGGHITKQDQRTLNQQENQISKDIGK